MSKGRKGRKGSARGAQKGGAQAAAKTAEKTAAKAQAKSGIKTGKKLPLVAIVGRPNVGKSTLFNKLTGARKAITEETAGVTRDRMYGLVEWNGRRFDVVDTGGLELDAMRTGGTAKNKTIARAMMDHSFKAVAEADVVIALWDATEGLTAVDRDILQRLRGVAKPTFHVANKVDHATREGMQYEFYEAGVEKVFPVSAEHGRGVNDLLDEVVEALPPLEERAKAPARERQEGEDESGEATADPDAPQTRDETQAPDLENRIRLAVIGRPNVGKSSLVNRLLGFERSIVAEVAGTTRDAVDTALEWDGQQFLLIDTAGIRRKARVHEKLELFSVGKALDAIGRADVAVLVIDAEDGVHEQDAKIAGEIQERGRACVIVMNKWDLAEAKGITREGVTEAVKQTVKFMDWAPILFVSAMTGENVIAIMQAAQDAFIQYKRRIPTPKLNKWLDAATSAHPVPVSTRGPVKLSFITTGGTRPPTVVIFSNQPEAIHFSYRRYLENALRAEYGFIGTPVKMVFKRKKGSTKR